MEANGDYIASLQSVASQYERNILRQGKILTERATKQKNDAGECQELAKALSNTAVRWRRAASLSAELFTEVSIEHASRKAEIETMKSRVLLNEQMLARAKTENDSIRQLIAHLNSM